MISIGKRIPKSMRSAYERACLDHGFDPLRYAPYSRMTVYEALAALGYDPLRNYDAEPPRPPRCAHPGCEFRAERLGERYCDLHRPIGCVCDEGHRWMVQAARYAETACPRCGGPPV